MGAINPMNYSLSERKLKIGKQTGKTVRIARARVRGRVSFARFCDLVAEHTTFNYMEVASIHILGARVLLRPNRSFFKLNDVTFERVDPKPQSKKKGKKKDSTTQPPNYGSEGGGHVGA